MAVRRQTDADHPETIPAAALPSQASTSHVVLNDLGSAISDEGSFDCHSSSANIVRNPTFFQKVLKM